MIEITRREPEDAGLMHSEPQARRRGGAVHTDALEDILFCR